MFDPDLTVARGDLNMTGAKPFLKMTQHPRSAGSPVVDNDGKLVAIVSATRDESPDKLSIITLDQVRKFAQGRFEPAGQTSAPPDQCVFELQATRRQ